MLLTHVMFAPQGLGHDKVEGEIHRMLKTLAGGEGLDAEAIAEGWITLNSITRSVQEVGHGVSCCLT